MSVTILAGMVTSLFSGSFTLIKQWYEGKQKNAEQELSIRQQEAKTNNEIRLQVAKGELDNTNERIKMMNSSWRDEWFTLLFSIPLLNLFISPFVDIVMVAEYREGMLAEAASEALTNLDNAPLWYIVIVLIMFCLSFGYEKGIDKILDVMNTKKNS